LFSFGTPHAKSNPFLALLVASIAEDADVHAFSWKFAFLGRYDVLHFHWPEHWFQQSTGWRLRVRVLLVRLLLLRTDIFRTLVVVTAHNIAPHEQLSRIQSRNLARITRRIDLWVILNPFTPTPEGARVVCIPHGHYRGWYTENYPPISAASQSRDELLFAGFIRPYKGVERLISEYRAAGDAIPMPLQIMGKPHSPALAAELLELAAGDPRITLTMDHVPDDVMRAHMLQSALIVLPYKSIHNSGIALLALSLSRPILVPENDVTRALRDEFGSAYVYLFQDDLNADRLVEVVALVGTTDWLEVGDADMSHREWPEIGRMHRAAYLEAIESRR